MAEEPIKVSSQSWTGLPPEPEIPPLKPSTFKPAATPVRSTTLLALLAVIFLSGHQVVSAIVEKELWVKAQWGLRGRGSSQLVTQAAQPLTFSTHASLAFVALLASSALTIWLVIDWLLESRGKSKSKIDWDRG